MAASKAYVWIHLPGATLPTLAGRLQMSEGNGTFDYAGLYRSSREAVPLDPVETPIVAMTLYFDGMRNGGLPGAVRDAARRSATRCWRMCCARSGRRDPARNSTNAWSLTLL